MRSRDAVTSYANKSLQNLASHPSIAVFVTTRKTMVKSSSVFASNSEMQ